MTARAQKRRTLLAIATVIFGVLLAVLTAFGLRANALNEAEKLAQGTMETLLRQCQGFDNIQAVNRARNLFSINENLTSLNATFVRNAATVSDEFLESYVEGMQLSGIAVLDGDLKLEASAYTRDLIKADWRDDFYPGMFERMVNSPTQVYARRMVVDGQYYDVCATARRDKPGVIIAYYEQPMSMIYDTEKDLKQLLESVRMDLDGEFIISASDRFILDSSASNNALQFVSAADGVLNADEIAALSFGGRRYFGMRSISQDYKVYLYFPRAAVFRDVYAGVLIVVLLYVSFCLTGVVFRAKAQRSQQRIIVESNRKLSESASIVQSLETVYFTIFYVDLQEDTYRSLILAPWLKKLIDENGVFTEAAKKLIDVSVMESYRHMILERLDFNHIRKRLKKTEDKTAPNSYYTDYEVDREGESMWCRITLTAVDFDAEKNPAHVLVMLQDVDYEKSKEVAYQMQIIKEADLAQSANRAKSAFLFNVSHDIRTPMNAILGYSDLAKKSLTDPQKVDRYLENIQISGERMLSLINEVLELARIENGKTSINEEAVRTGDGIRSCIVIVAPSAKEKRIEVSLTTDFVHPYVWLDRSHMSRVVLNLLNNAIKFTPEGGKIDCIVRQLAADTPDRCITEITVKDNGIGISSEFLPHMFETFAREKNSTISGITGTGLGLGIVKKLVDLMGGTIEAESVEGKGSTFVVRTPNRIATAEEALAVETEYDVVKESVKGKRVLIVEDGDMNAEILGEIIQSYGIETDRAVDGEDCLRILSSAPSDYYHLVLMDIQMPKMDGFAATSAIRKNPNAKIATIPIVAMTANAFLEDRQRSLESGMNDHLSKPIDSKELLLVFERYLHAELFCLNINKRGGYLNLLSNVGGYVDDDE